MGIYKMNLNNRAILMLILVAFAYVTITHASGNAAIEDNNETAQLGGDTDESMDFESDLSEMESDDNFAPVENNQLLELEKQKQELELENQKMQLKQLENKQVNEVAPVHEDVKEDNVKGLGLCNQQHNYNEKSDNGSLLNMADCNSDYYTLSDDYLSSTKQKIKPNELLPKEAVDMKGENFLNATLSQSTEQAIGKPTQVHRSRKNWDLRSTPPNPQVEVSPWNMSTIDPDTTRRHFEIGASSNEVTA